MITINSEVLGKAVSTGRLIGKVEGNHEGPTLVLLGGMHGNEPFGVFAISEILNHLEGLKGQLHGKVYGFAGNLKALESRQRYVDEDLNRLWRDDVLKGLDHEKWPEARWNNELHQLVELRQELNQVLDEAKGPSYFIDLHTTSASGGPFMFMTHTPANLKYSEYFPVPAIVGIDKYIKGALLSLVSKRGYVSLAFEGGQHEDPASFDLMRDFSWLSLAATGCLTPELIPNLRERFNRLKTESALPGLVFDMLYRHPVIPEDQFEMRSGFESFQRIAKGDWLANDRNGRIKAEFNGHLFMPLYQKQGEDGFFLIGEMATANSPLDLETSSSEAPS
ncbi:MAG: succinylglutamate desuccinylase/aspartoacylase family protein [Salibacteraceae bacterium]